jgi:hypothetical protein
MPIRVTAGIAGNIAAIGAVNSAIAVSMIFAGAPIAPTMPDTTREKVPAAPSWGGGAESNGATVALTTSSTTSTRARWGSSSATATDRRRYHRPR